MAKRNYFLFNKEQDFKRGYLSNFTWDQQSLKMDSSSYKDKGIFISRILDSREIDMEWHRITMTVDEKTSARFKTYVYCSNELERQVNGKTINIKEVLQDESIPMSEKLATFQHNLCREVINQKDLLLHGVIGRYLWMVIEVFSSSSQSFELGNIKVSFPKESWLKYLPDIYTSQDKNNFLERYIAVFQSLYEDLNDRIYDVPYLFDISSTSKELLDWMADWIDVSESYMWPEERLRNLLEKGISLFKKRGTKHGMSEFLEVFTGQRPFIVEYHELDKYSGISAKHMKDMLTDSPYSFTVLVKEEFVKSPREYSVLTKIIDEMKPVHMEVELMVLKPYMYLGDCSLLGINSQLNEYKTFDLDGLAQISFSTVLKGQDEEREGN